MDDHADTTSRSDEPWPAPRAARPSTRLKNALLLAGTLALIFCAAELILRAAYHPENLASVVRFDGQLGWALKAKATLRSRDDRQGIDYLIRTNSLGLRDREISKTKGRDKKRILVLGDSIAYGTGVDAEWRFSDFLSRALGDGVEVVNAGVCGWGTDQELLFYERRGRFLDPDVVVLAFTMANDVLNNSLDHLFLGSAPKPRFVLRNGSLALEKETVAPPDVRLDHRIVGALRKSRVLLFVKRRVDALVYERHVKQAFVKDHGGFDKEGLDRDYSHWTVYEHAHERPFEDAWGVTEALLGRLSKRCEEDGAKLVVFAFPLKLEVDDAWRQELFHHFAIDSTLLDFGRPYARLAAACAERGIGFVYPLEAFREASRLRPLYFDHDSHPNAFGHAAAAGVLLGVLRDRYSMEFRVAESDTGYAGLLLTAVSDATRAPAPHGPTNLNIEN